jgi:hypothetical protein
MSRNKTKTMPQLRADPANPNRMADEDKARMALSLAEFGDLSGITLNRRTGMLIGGHQRVSVMPDGALDVTDIAEPEPDGTVARGYLTHLGRRYAVRVVDWPSDKAHAALLAANRFGRVGHDDGAALKDLLQELDTGALDMELTGYTLPDIEQLMNQYHVEPADAPNLKDGDRAPFRQATFTLHDEQWEEVEAAIAKAKKDGGGESAVNENSNGNALAWICRAFNGGRNG